jgi:hypothetical protein
MSPLIGTIKFIIQEQGMSVMLQDMVVVELHEKNKADIIRAIKEKMGEIANGDLSEPLYLKNVTVLDSSCSPNDEPVYMKLNSIFCDEEGILCGDMVGDLNNFANGIMFGQSVEELQLEDLENILDNLNDESWSVILNDTGVRNKKIPSINPFLKKAISFARGA